MISTDSGLLWDFVSSRLWAKFMLRLLSISKLLKKESGLRMWVMMMMVVAWVLIETVKLYGNQD
jgi:hypothetical protein